MDKVKLGRWVQRYCGLMKKEDLDDNRQLRLGNLGVVWDIKKVNVESN